MPDLLLTEEERMLQSAVREFADRELTPRSREVDEREEFSWENWNGMAALGLTGIGIDPALGGSGGGYRADGHRRGGGGPGGCRRQRDFGRPYVSGPPRPSTSMATRDKSWSSSRRWLGARR